MGTFSRLCEPEALEREMAALLSSPEEYAQALSHLSYTHGVLTAVIIGPKSVPPSRWVPTITNLEDSSLDDEDKAAAMAILMAQYNDVVSTLAGEEGVDDEGADYEPFFWIDSDDREVARNWAEGFIAGMRLCARAWGPLVADDDARNLLAPILLQLDPELVDDLLPELPRDREEIIAAARNVIGDCVLAIRDYWRERGVPLHGLFAPAGRSGAPAMPQRRSAPKIGRNAPCPCGSGRKYKKCCMQ